jgi:hypothetical protein
VGAEWRRTEFGGNREGFTFTPKNTLASYGVSVSWSPFQRPAGVLAEPVALAQGHAQCVGEVHEQLPAGPGPSVLHEAEVLGGDAGRGGELQLAHAAALPPEPQHLTRAGSHAASVGLGWRCTQEVMGGSTCGARRSVHA